METIELELQQIASANLYHLIPSYLFDYFKDELNDRILVNLINDLDSLIQTIETNNSFKILSLNENTDNENDNRDRVVTNEQPPSSSLNSEVVLLNSCKSLLSDISIRLNEIFTKYSSEINLIIDLFERQQYQQKRFNSKIYFSSRNDLVVYQRAILVQHLNTKHYELFNLVFRNVFDYYQNSINNNNASLSDQDETLVTDGMTEQDDKMNESGLNSSTNMKLNNQILLDNFDKINQIL